MPTCFVIQPFDKGVFDKRYRDVYAPAIRAAGFEPYRVDQDPGVTVPIESIESGIRDAQICLADITLDNPNVWYELGFAYAARKPVVMVCSEDRGAKFPFDIQHRTVVTYKTESQSDFVSLAESLKLKLIAVSKRDEQLEQIAEAQAVAPVDGLSLPELTLLAVVATGVFSPDASISLWSIKNDAEKGGMTGMGFNLALRRLLAKSFVVTGEEFDERTAEPFSVLSITSAGWDWIDANESKFNLHRAHSKPDAGY